MDQKMTRDKKVRILKNLFLIHARQLGKGIFGAIVFGADFLNFKLVWENHEGLFCHDDICNCSFMPSSRCFDKKMCILGKSEENN